MKQVLSKTTEDKIVEKAQKFDIIALLNLLKHLGYSRDDILFKSCINNTSSRGLIEKIAFRKQPSRQVIIWLNMGLLSPSTPLPSFFMKVFDRGDIDEESFVNFMNFFDHKLLDNYLHGIYPENNEHYFRQWEEAKRSYLYLLNLNTINFLHWMFEIVFPELGLSVKASSHNQKFKSSGARLGNTTLGDIVALGAASSVPVKGFDIKLYSEEETMSDLKTPWADEVKRRLREIIFPLVKDFSINFRIFLIIQSQEGWAQLKKESYLGVDRIRGGQVQARQILVFRGMPS